ncbi:MULTISPECIES: FAD-dependent monooxygenase [unclassified Corynebacterium]|uniref:FAD-dependent monooxygenase n=1 Tax=unclassified Corynebacterium TaxID=2624378 RepID=UPI0026570395|nr:FAD-dependent monooxygenase [Corynebacterium sp.]MDN6325347.1 FAD-dependent monooxygenase [Corynebacterium sp.]MDN6509595.1 FAD-dependent monooxygenase [Corynebacterium sp.]
MLRKHGKYADTGAMQAREALKIVVVGGSLAGLMTGISLARQGHHVTMLERADRIRPSGASLLVREDDLRSILGPEQARAAVRMAGPVDARAHGEVPATWQGLYEGLCQVAEGLPTMDMHHRTRAVEVGQEGERAWARADDGETYTGDLLVGADGYRSLVRASVAPDRPDAEFAGYVLWLGVAKESDLDYTGPWPGGLDIRDSGDNLLLGYPLASPEGSTEPGERRLGWGWYDNSRNHVLRETGAVRGNVTHHTLRGHDVDQHVLADLVREAGLRWPHPWRAAIEDCLSRTDFLGTPINEYVPDRLRNGRMVILGDAAHVPTPMTGRGFATSLDDAAALARHMADATAATLPDTLASYESERLAPAQELVLSGQMFSRSFGRP